MNFDAVYTVSKEFEKETFLRELLIKLGINGSTPIDAVDAKFGEIDESVKEVVVCTAHVEGRCAASIGYDRKEPYTDYETYREKVGNQYITHQRPVTKYRTVTDWQPYQTNYAGEATCAAYNTDTQESDDHYIVAAIKTTNIENVVVDGKATVNQNGAARALAICESNVQMSTVNLPGDRERDVRYYSDSTIKELNCYKLPYYEVAYTYEGKKYKASCFACGDIEIQAERMPSRSNDITAAVKKKTARFKTAMGFSWVLFWCSLIGAALLCYFAKFAWLCPVPVILLIKAKADSNKYAKKYKETSDSMSKDISQSKIEALKNALKKHGLEPLSRNDNKNVENFSVDGAKPLKSIGGRVAIAWVLTVILVIASIFTGFSAVKQNLHSPKHVNISVVDKEERYDPDASPYINGCYYIDLEYQINSEKLGVEYINVKVHITDKGGTELGVITSSLSYLDVQKGEDALVTTTLQENQPDENEFFTTLYQTDLSDLGFEFEINSIKFSDGEYYHSDEY